MDFKTRFQGKTSHISRDGAIDDVVQTTTQPINKVDRITMSNQYQNDQLISYANNTSSSYNKSSYSQQFSGVLYGPQKQPSFDSSQQSNYDNYQLSEMQSPSPMKKLNLNDLNSDNIYLKGNNMAEAIYTKQSIQNNGGMSIAMRMKRNREAASQQYKQQIAQNNEDENYYSVTPFNGSQQVSSANQNLEQQNWAAQTTKYSETSQGSAIKTPISTQQSQRVVQNNQNSNKSYLKPPSTISSRSAIEQTRQTNFTKVSQQIVSQQSSNVTLQDKLQTQVKSKLELNTIKRQNSLAPQVQQQQQNPYQSQIPSKHRSTSVNAVDMNDFNQNQQTQLSQARERLQILQQKRGGAFRSAGAKSLVKADDKSKVADKNSEYSSKSLQQTVTQNPYVQQQPLLNGQAILSNQQLSPQDLQQQVLMMQQQLMLIYQQQQFMQNQPPPPNTSPPQLQQQSQTISLNQPDVYKQIELADKNFTQGKPGAKNTTTQSQALDKQSNSSIYQPYSVKDYKNMQSTLQTLKMGGLGANIGGEDWEKAKKKKQIALEYSKNIRVSSINKPPTNNKRIIEINKDKPSSSRVKAIAPKPQWQNVVDGSEYNNDRDVIQEEPYEENQVTLKGNQLTFFQLNDSNDNYADELEEIRRMIE